MKIPADFVRYEYGVTHSLTPDGVYAARELLKGDLTPPTIQQCRRLTDDSLEIVGTRGTEIVAVAQIPQGQWSKI